MSLKDDWKKTGTGLGHAFKDLGKTIIHSASTAVKKADEWAGNEEAPARPEEQKEENTENK